MGDQDTPNNYPDLLLIAPGRTVFFKFEVNLDHSDDQNASLMMLGMESETSGEFGEISCDELKEIVSKKENKVLVWLGDRAELKK